MKLQSIIYLIFFLWGAWSCVWAQSGISVSPPRTYFTLSPGESDRKTILITNVSEDQTLELSASFNDWTYDDFGSNVIKEPNTLSNSCSNWLTVLPANTLTLGPKESKEIEVLMQVPENLTADEVHTTMLYITQTNPIAGENKAGENIKISLRTGVKIYHRLNVTRDQNIEFINYEFDKTANQLILTLENIGNVWSEGTIKNEIISQKDGSIIQLDDVVYYSLPKDKRIVKISLPKDLAKTSFIATSILSLGDTDQIKIAELSFTNE